MILSDQSFAEYRKEFHFSVYHIARQVIKGKTVIVQSISFNEGLRTVKVYLHLPAAVHISNGTKAGLIVKIRNWRRAILLTRYVFFAAPAMVEQAVNILCAINSLQWAALMAVMVAVEHISY